MARRKKQTKNMSKMRQLIAKLSPKSTVAEQYRTVRTNLQFAAVDETLQAVLVTSASPEEGKSMTAANLAIVYAQQGKKVLLVDADMRKPTMHYTFQLENLQGLSNVLVGDTMVAQAIQASGEENLDVITCGPVPPNPSELLASKRMQELMNDLRQSYDVIIVDSPPVLAVTDAQILSNVCDGTVLVVRSKQTEIEAGQKAIEALRSVNARVLGTILNGRDKKDKNYYYYYYHK
ncbi:CpsD/CapB family tyrosine-protein kinase [Oceanobacillus senegalensis]|uniref:CpsD/CapB family tyrosine-protein kinase n=1 Tax=Oceanobacillus senegalensis TaxID=1936063 RepID=UPI000A30A3BD|nr:CpsD/CapB family tyrosine-protein kinase [Oceanobacillus senegalensis]